MIVLMMLVFYGGIAFLLMKTYSYFFGNNEEIEEPRETRRDARSSGRGTRSGEERLRL